VSVPGASVVDSDATVVAGAGTDVGAGAGTDVGAAVVAVTASVEVTVLFGVLGADVLSVEAGPHPASSSAAPSAIVATLIDRVLVRLMNAYSRIETGCYTESLQS
jgi:hypothetical protein